MGRVGMNTALLPENMSMPIIGKGARPTKVVYHHGCGSSALVALVMLPEYGAIFVAAVGGLLLNDLPDLATQFLVDRFLGGALPPTEFIEYAKATSAENLRKSQCLQSNLRKESLSPELIASYLGTYKNHGDYFRIEVSADGHALFLSFQCKDSEKHRLHPCETEHVFRWGGSRNELAKRGSAFPVNEDHQTIRFKLATDGTVTTLIWLHDRENPKAGEFTKLYVMDLNETSSAGGPMSTGKIAACYTDSTSTKSLCRDKEPEPQDSPTRSEENAGSSPKPGGPSEIEVWAQRATFHAGGTDEA